MYKFSKKSKNKLYECHIDLIDICESMMGLGVMDFTILQGYRGEEDQNTAFAEGKSNARFGQSLHNVNPSRAVDIAPYPIDWQDTEKFAQLAGMFKAVAAQKGIAVRWGGDFKSIKDMPHFELT